TEPELADFTDGEASDEGAGEPDLLEEVDTGIGDLAELDEAAMEEPAPEDAGGDNAIGLEEVALGTAAAAMAGAATSNTSTDSTMNGDKDESGALVAQAGPERLLNFQHEVVVEVARTKLTGEEITQITYGSIIELDKVAGEPVNLVLDGKVIAHGEMVLINEDNLGIRIIGIMQE
ncbi:MAG: FliM/FliN family flagellar motor switch protein, partial [SAR324 cluster bacterium]|nr:FliM/FliN family flagellar motor switch protein [SAR324 cluster bacterium]